MRPAIDLVKLEATLFGGRRRERRDVFRESVGEAATAFRAAARHAITQLRGFAQTYGHPTASAVAQYETTIRELLTARSEIESLLGGPHAKVSRAANSLSLALTRADSHLDAARPVSVGEIDKCRDEADQALARFNAAFGKVLVRGRRERAATRWIRKKSRVLRRRRHGAPQAASAVWRSGADNTPSG